jgi:hypothetical protein
VKDFVQPVALVYAARLLGSDASDGGSVPRSATVLLGCVYCVLYLLSAVASRRSYFVKRRFASDKAAMDALFDVYAATCAAIAAVLWAWGDGISGAEARALADGGGDASTDPASADAVVGRQGAPAVGVVVALLYVPLYVTYNFFKPVSASAVSDLAGKQLRATMMSADTLVQTMLVAALAPLVGLASDEASLALPFGIVAALMLVAGRGLGLADASLCGSLMAAVARPASGGDPVTTTGRRPLVHGRIDESKA